MKRHLVLAVLLMMCCAFAAPASAQSKAAAAFKKLQSLAGEWEGQSDKGHPVKTSFKVIAGSTTVFEMLDMHGMEQMATLYSIDGDSIALVHYCPTNNQPRMRATPGPGEPKVLDFSFQGAGNLPDSATGHEHKLVLTFEDKDHITEAWTWRENGKDTVFLYHLTRKSGP
jgi:hypothetical protein